MALNLFTSVSFMNYRVVDLQLRLSAPELYFCRHKRGTLKSATQVKPHRITTAGLIKLYLKTNRKQQIAPVIIPCSKCVGFIV